jgi:uncharacterized protein YndB with AHSA1/START domain
MTSTFPETFDVVSTRVFPVEPAVLWQAWSNGELVKQWWGPTGFTCPVCEMNFTDGGTTLVCMRAPEEWGGFDLFNTWTYSTILPYESIAYVLHFSDAEGNRTDPEAQGLPADIPKEGVHHFVTFTPVGEGSTELTVTEYGYGSQETADNSKAGLEQCLDKMMGIFVQP